MILFNIFKTERCRNDSIRLTRILETPLNAFLAQLNDAFTVYMEKFAFNPVVLVGRHNY